MDGNTTHGDTGWFFGEEMMPKEFQDAVKNHKLGEIFLRRRIGPRLALHRQEDL
jgi:alkylhydroperoxidase/carboxymuconolactone decarboxylase family protein YurZ